MTIHDVDCFIDGGVVTATDTFDVIDPSTGKTLAAVSRGGPAQIDYAVKAAQSASKAWSPLAARDRADHLRAVGAANAGSASSRRVRAVCLAAGQSRRNVRPVRGTTVGWPAPSCRTLLCRHRFRA